MTILNLLFQVVDVSSIRAQSNRSSTIIYERKLPIFKTMSPIPSLSRGVRLLTSRRFNTLPIITAMVCVPYSVETIRQPIKSRYLCALRTISSSRKITGTADGARSGTLRFPIPASELRRPKESWKFRWGWKRLINNTKMNLAFRYIIMRMEMFSWFHPRNVANLS